MPHVVLTSQYDANSNRTSLAGTIAGTADFLNTYAYDALDRLTQLVQQSQTGGNAVAIKGANLTYNALGQLATIFRTNFFGVGPAPDIATSTLSYDGANRLTSIAYTHNGGTATDAFSWAYDAANRVTSMTTTADGTATYNYDNTNQVTGASYAGTGQPANESYTYDSNGNRTNTGYATGTNNQLSSDGTFNYGYDHEGNRISRTRISNAPANDYLTNYTVDFRNRLTDVQFYNNSSVLTKHVHYTYDIFDHLIGKQVDDTGGGTYDRAERYVLDGNDVVLQFDANGSLTRRYLNGPSASGVDSLMADETVTSLTSPGTVTWPLTDNLGTVRDIVDSTGAVIDHLVYNSFGQIAHETAPTVHHLQGYAGGIYDADTGLVGDWHRWYDPSVGRWISEDPLEFAAGDANLVRYTGNSPTVFVDPTGLIKLWGQPFVAPWDPRAGGFGETCRAWGNAAVVAGAGTVGGAVSGAGTGGIAGGIAGAIGGGIWTGGVGIVPGGVAGGRAGAVAGAKYGAGAGFIASMDCDNPNDAFKDGLKAGSVVGGIVGGGMGGKAGGNLPALPAPLPPLFPRRGLPIPPAVLPRGQLPVLPRGRFPPPRPWWPPNAPNG